MQKLQVICVLLQQAEKNLDVIMPGYTHLQTAQPILFAHHMLAYVEMIKRDTGRLRDLLKGVFRLSIAIALPLCSGVTHDFDLDSVFIVEVKATTWLVIPLGSGLIA